MKYEELQYERLGDANKTYTASTLVIRKQFVDAAIAELKEVYKDSVDVKIKIWERCKKAEDELRKTQRALWLARAERAKEMCKRLLIQGFDPKWEEVESKCRAKAEEYK